MQQWQKIKEQFEPFVFRLSVVKHQYEYRRPYQWPSDMVYTGTGFYLQDGWLITNAHVCENCLSIVGENDQMKINLSVEYICKERDIGFLYSKDLIPFFKKKSLPIKQENGFFLDFPQEVMALGYPLGHRTLKATLGVASGWYSNIDDTIGAYRMPTFEYSPAYFMMTAPIAHGSSGGIVINKDGKVIGISSGGEEEEAPTMQYSLTIDYVKLLFDYIFTNKKENNRVIRWPKYSFDFFPLSEDLFDGKGIYIKSISQDSFFRFLEIGDILLSLSTIDLLGFNIDVTVQCTGELFINYNKYKRTMTFKEFFQSIPYNSIIQTKIWRNKKEFIYNEKYCINDENVFISYAIPSLEPSSRNYICFGPLVLTNAVYNSFMQEATECNSNGSRNGVGRTQGSQMQKGIMICQILPPSELFSMEVFQEGQYISKINDKPIYNIEGINKKLLGNNKEELIIIENDQNDKYICSHKRWEDDSSLCKQTYPFYKN